MPGVVNLPPQVLLSERVGDKSDAVQVLLGDQQVQIYEDYAIQMSVLQQPAAFTLRLGWSEVAAELLDIAQPGIPFELRVAGVAVQTGRIDGRRLRGSSGGSFVEVKGRDWMAGVFDSFVEEERGFANATYYDLTRTVLDLCGLKDRGLEATNAAYQKAIAGFQTVKVVNEETVKAIETGAAAQTQTKVVNKTLKAKLGERWLDWLQRQYKLVGLFLWCTGEGNFVLGEPQWDQEPAFTILKARGITTEFATVLDTDWNDDTTGRFAEIVVHGRSGGGAVGRAKVKGSYVDAEMVARGFTKRLVVHDEDCKTKDQCEYVARRTAAEQRRAGWTLRYTVSGHTVPGIKGPGVAIWGPDLTCRVSDDEIPIEGKLYIEAIEFSRKPETTTTLTLMRPEDLVFAQKVSKAPKLQRRPRG